MGMRTEIYKYRRLKGLSQQQLADAVGVSRQTIVSLEKERYIASLQLAYKISKYFGYSIEEVFHMEGE
jgi:putative transcriptional regulator